MMISITSFILDLSLWAYMFSIIFVFTISFLSLSIKDVPTEEKIELLGCQCNDNGKIFSQCKIDFVTWCNSFLHDILG